MLSRKEAIRQRLAKKLQKKRDATAAFYHSPVTAFGIALPEKGKAHLRLKDALSEDHYEWERLTTILGDMDICRKALNRDCEPDSVKHLILSCAFRVMESFILSAQLANGDVFLDPSFSVTEYLAVAQAISLHRHKLCDFASKRVSGDIPVATEQDGVDQLRDVIIHELRICVEIHEMIDLRGPVPSVTHALQWLSRWNVIHKRLNGALDVPRPLRIQIVHDAPRPEGFFELFREVPLLASVEFEDVMSAEGVSAFLEGWAQNARFPENDFDLEGCQRFMRAQWDRFSRDDD
jgi:hypothetical protein